MLNTTIPYQQPLLHITIAQNLKNVHPVYTHSRSAFELNYQTVLFHGHKLTVNIVKNVRDTFIVG